MQTQRLIRRQVASPRAGALRASVSHRAFTLIELLVVITIIGILATITLQVVGGLLSHAKDAATKTTLTKIQGLLNSRAQAFDRLMQRKGYLTGSYEYQQAQLNYSSAPATTQTILAKKMLQIKFFPQNPKEVTNANLFPNTANNSNAQSSEILYDFLTQANLLGDSVVGADAFSTSEVKDTDLDGLPSFVDAWGNPLRFYRWPTRLFRSGGQTGANAVSPITTTDVANVQQLFATLPVFSGNLINDLARDPDDPLQECRTNVTNFETTFHTPATFHVFLVVSAGPDGTLGLYEPDFIDTTNNIRGDLAQVKDVTALNDDIISLNIRAGGK